jgi:hypothetical protein
MSAVAKRVSQLPFAPVVGAMFALAAILLVFAAPMWLLERGATQSGIAGVLPLASPLVARGLLALLAAFGAGAAIWAMMIPVGRRLDASASPAFEARPFAAAADEEVLEVPLRRRSLIVAPPAPILATEELGSPLMSDEALADAPVAREEAPAEVAEAVAEIQTEVETGATVVEDAPANDDVLVLDAPITAEAVPDPMPLPMEPVLAPVPDIAAGPASAIPVPPPEADAGADTIADLVDRLERGLLRKLADRPAAASDEDAALREALIRLERLAVAR